MYSASFRHLRLEQKIVRGPDWEACLEGVGNLELIVLALALSLELGFGRILLNFTSALVPVGEISGYGILVAFDFFYTTFNFSFT